MNRLLCTLLYAGCLIAILASLPSAAAAEDGGPTYGRLWLYGNLTVKVDPSLALTLLPGVRTEFSRSGQAARGRYMDELFVGPTYLRRLGPLSLRVSLWYYFTGFPGQDREPYDYTHSLEVVPVVAYTWGPFNLASRTILHNILHASRYDSPKARTGYSLVVRELVQLSFRLGPQLALVLAEEPFWGVVEDEEAPAALNGFWPNGWRLNRVYAGLDVLLGGRWRLSPRYIYETALDDQQEVEGHGHYFFLTLAALVDLTR